MLLQKSKRARTTTFNSSTTNHYDAAKQTMAAGNVRWNAALRGKRRRRGGEEGGMELVRAHDNGHAVAVEKRGILAS